MADKSNLIPVAEAIKGILEEKLEKTAESSPTEPARTQPHLEPKSFFWDNIIIYLAYTILGLSVSNIVVDFVRPEPNTVKCYTSMNISRDQTVYINNYCYEYLPFSENFTLALVTHGAALLVPYYLWKTYFSARLDFFFTHAAKLETLRDRNTGEYPHKNFSIVNYMHREFHKRSDILIGYIIKLAAQLCTVLLALFISVGIFQDFDAEFDCPRKADHHLFAKVKCTYPKLRFISILRWIDYALLSISLLVLFYGLYWCTIRSHPELGYKNISQFCYDSCINSESYKDIKRYRLKNDLHFLLISLYATNAGLGRVFRSLQIANRIRHELDAQFESLDNFDSMKSLRRRKYRVHSPCLAKVYSHYYIIAILCLRCYLVSQHQYLFCFYIISGMILVIDFLCTYIVN